ncbi:MAG: hypothetical protein WCP18_01620 [bacterium]
MPDKLQEVFNRIQESKKEQKQIKSSYRDALLSSAQYQKISEELKELRDKKKEVEETIRVDFRSEYAKLEDLKIDLETDYEMLSDIALTQLMKGETISITDINDVKYEPAFSVRFKKAN